MMRPKRNLNGLFNALIEPPSDRENMLGPKDRAGHLNLDRTLWGMRRANEPRPPGKPGGGAGGGGEVWSASGPRYWHPAG
jgi:hypothetical protein